MGNGPRNSAILDTEKLKSKEFKAQVLTLSYIYASPFEVDKDFNGLFYFQISMNTYIRTRVRNDCEHMMLQSDNEEKVQHPGVRGRFRELLIDNLLAPWLPPYAACGTGTVVDTENHIRPSTQDDIVIFDRSLVPHVLASNHAPDGIFPMDGVLCRIEVKSTLNRSNLRDAVLAAEDINKMKFSGAEDKSWPLPVNVVFAFKSDLKGEPMEELKRLIEVYRDLNLYHNSSTPELPGPISCLCVANRGCWAYGGSDTINEPSFLEATLNERFDEIVMFVGAVSNTCFRIHINRQGRDPLSAVEGGIGRFILDNSCYHTIKIQ